VGLLYKSFIVVRADPIPNASDLHIPIDDLDTWLGRLEQRAKPKPRKHRPEINDYYAVPLPDGRFGHLHYVHEDPMWGDLVQVLSVITDQPRNAYDRFH
jgi:hypothetical protein